MSTGDGGLRYRERYRVPTARRRGWDYRWSGVYSVTICTRWRIPWLGEIREGEMALSPCGQIVEQEWQRIPGRHPHVVLDTWVIMPDHMHGILIFEATPGPAKDQPAGRLFAASLGAVVGQFKSKSTKRIRALGPQDFAWQTRFYDQILKTTEELDRARIYIQENPRRWEEARRDVPVDLP